MNSHYIETLIQHHNDQVAFFAKEIYKSLDLYEHYIITHKQLMDDACQHINACLSLLPDHEHDEVAKAFQQLYRLINER